MTQISIRGRQRFWCVPLILFSLAPGLRAQGEDPAEDSPPAEEEGVYFETVDVTVVNVEVFVTDKKGNRVTGLTVDDFELTENGRPVEITNFYAVEGGEAVATPTRDAGRASIQPDVEVPVGQRDPATAAPAPLPEEQRLYLVVYFDNLFLKPFTRNKVIDQVRRFLVETVGLDDRVMLVTFERSLHVRVPFTNDVGTIVEELDKVALLTGYGEQSAADRREVIRRLDQTQSVTEAYTQVDFYAKEVHNDLLNSIGALKELVGSLGGLTGRKVLLYVSDGIPMTPGEDLFFLLDTQFTKTTSNQLAASIYRARRDFRELTAKANANRVTFYTLEAAGLRSHSSLSAEYGHRDTSILEADVMWDGNREEPLLQMAGDTGGLAATNTNNIFGALESMRGDFDNYYSLGYSPVHAVPGRYYKVEVRIKKPGLKVRHRAGYRDKSPETRVHEGTMAALVYGAESNPLSVRLELGRGRPDDDGRYLVPVEVRIPLGNITLMPGPGLHRGRLLIAVGVIDNKGRLSPVTQTPVPIDIPESDVAIARQQEFVYEVELLMRQGEQAVAVGVRDEVAGDTSFVREGVRVGAGA